MFNRYQPSTLRRRMAALRQAIGGVMPAEQLTSFVFDHPELLSKQPAMVKEFGAWLQANMAHAMVGSVCCQGAIGLPASHTSLLRSAAHTPGTEAGRLVASAPGSTSLLPLFKLQVRALLEHDPSLLGASVWLLKETAAKLRLWTDIVGVPLPAVLQHYGACVGDIDILLPDLAAAYVLVQAGFGVVSVQRCSACANWLHDVASVSTCLHFAPQTAGPACLPAPIPNDASTLVAACAGAHPCAAARRGRQRLPGLVAGPAVCAAGNGSARGGGGSHDGALCAEPAWQGACGLAEVIERLG